MPCHRLPCIGLGSTSGTKIQFMVGLGVPPSRILPAAFLLTQPTLWLVSSPQGHLVDSLVLCCPQIFCRDAFQAVDYNLSCRCSQGDWPHLADF